MTSKNKKVVVITGAAGGIGAALADEAMRRGYRLALADLDTVALEILGEKFKSDCVCHQLDVSDPDAMNQFAEDIFKQFGRVDMLFNNAGIFNTGKILDQSHPGWQKIMQVNLFGVLNGVHAFGPRMLESGLPSHIVNTASVSGLFVSPMVGAYSVSKTAVVALSEILHFEMQAEKNPVNISVICPGAVKTRILEADRHGEGMDRSEKADKYLGKMQIALSENGMEPEKLARLVFDQVLAGKFWITPHPDLLEPVVRRAENIVSGINPVFRMRRTIK